MGFAKVLHDGRMEIRPWPSEGPLLITCLVVSILIWLALLLSIIGIFYGALFGSVLLVLHLVFVARVRGSAIAVGPTQLPELHARVCELSERFGLASPPETYVMQADGALNALASRFLRSDMLILYSDLLEACSEDEAARDMIIGHELGHLRAGHLRLRWLLAPGLFVPFLGTALSRAREFTCDRYGLAAAGQMEGAVRGLTVLAAGPYYGRLADPSEFAAQRSRLDTALMKIGEWLSTHPPLSSRVSALQPLERLSRSPAAAAASRRAVALLAATWGGVLLLGFGAAVLVSRASQTMHALETAAAEHAAGFAPEEVWWALERVAGEIDSIAASAGELPDDDAALLALWLSAHGSIDGLRDPYTGFVQMYGYRKLDDRRYLLHSAGPDGVYGTGDDLVYDSWEGRVTGRVPR